MSCPPKSTIWPLVAILLTAMMTTGCTTVGGKSSLNLSDPGQAELEQAERQAPTCTVVLKPGQGKPVVMEMPVTEGATVQTALEHSKATRKFRRMDIHVLRPAQVRGNTPVEAQKMTAKFDRQHREVEIDHDYALYPNDRVMIEEDQSTMVDDMFQTIAGRMGLPMMRQMVK
jgi:hypothetical protein